LKDLLKDTIVKDNPMLKEEEELRKICIMWQINNPIIGEE